jgi:hypothetical protein
LFRILYLLLSSPSFSLPSTLHSSVSLRSLRETEEHIGIFFIDWLNDWYGCVTLLSHSISFYSIQIKIKITTCFLSFSVFFFLVNEWIKKWWMIEWNGGLDPYSWYLHCRVSWEFLI